MACAKKFNVKIYVTKTKYVNKNRKNIHKEK